MTHTQERLNEILPERRDGTISSVIIMPERMEFETQNPNERVFIMLRGHIATNLSWIITGVFFSIIPPIILYVLSLMQIDFETIPFFRDSYVVVAIMLWYLLVFTSSFMKFLDWYFNLYVITSERVLDFDFSAFAYHKISEASLDNIVDATQESIGFLPMFFNYGDVYIQTAGERREFDFLSVPKPSWVRDKIMDLRNLMVKHPV
ncbi:MAG: PH domain-containing protein [Candidatus Dojkabacteria bacterium]|jgi:hypothetical protein|nr:PH domain-containing protein [Candidatus Dojkabacteria bacterium]